MKRVAQVQVLSHSHIHRELSNLFINKYIPGPHVPFSVHISRWRINTLQYHPFVIIDSVDKRFKLNKRSLDIRNSGNQKHERHDLPCFNLPSWTTGTNYACGVESVRNPGSFYMYNPQHYQLIMALSRRIPLCNTSTLLLSTSF